MNRVDVVMAAPSETAPAHAEPTPPLTPRDVIATETKPAERRRASSTTPTKPAQREKE